MNTVYKYKSHNYTIIPTVPKEQQHKDLPKPQLKSHENPSPTSQSAQVNCPSRNHFQNNLLI